MAIDYTDWNEVTVLLADAQSADEDNRQRARDADHFIHKSDGQWDPAVLKNLGNRPHFTFDMTSPIVKSITGEIAAANFDIKVRPAGGNSSKEIAKTYDGLIRNIENISNAGQIYNANTKAMVTKGISGWRIIHDWVDGDSFDQDLLIEDIPNFENTCWIDYGSTKQDASDANWAFILKAMPKEDYETKWPNGSGMSISDSRTNEVYYNKADQVVIGEVLYRKEVKVKLHKMNNGAIYEEDEKFNAIKDEFKAKGIEIEKTRERTTFVVKTRLFDGSAWLAGEQDTAFRMIPIIPEYGDFEISENKLIYKGAVEPHMDQQRSFNYAASRSIEEGALAPRAKYFATAEQVAPYKDTWETLNTNADPLQLYKHIDGIPEPYWSGGAQINPGLQATMQQMAGLFGPISGRFSANQGENPGLQSGVAIQEQVDEGNDGSMDWFKSVEVAICRTATILVDTIPRVYDSKRQVRILGEDGAFDIVTLHDREFDEESNEFVEVNDLSQGTYDVTCDVGAAFKNRQQEAVNAILEQAKIDPSILQVGGDIMLKNNPAPGMDLLSERVRALMIQQGVIPQDQWTDEEKAQSQQAAQLAAQQPQQPDALMVAAQAEQGKADAAIAKVQVEAQKVQIGAQKNEIDAAKVQLDAEKQQFEQQKAVFEANAKAGQGQADQLSQQVDDYGKKVDAMAKVAKMMAEGVTGSAPLLLLQQSGLIVDEAQDMINPAGDQGTPGQ